MAQRIRWEVSWKSVHSFAHDLDTCEEVCWNGSYSTATRGQDGNSTTTHPAPAPTSSADSRSAWLTGRRCCRARSRAVRHRPPAASGPCGLVAIDQERLRSHPLSLARPRSGKVQGDCLSRRRQRTFARGSRSRRMAERDDDSMKPILLRDHRSEVRESQAERSTEDRQIQIQR
jgi:hypothetical protein